MWRSYGIVLPPVSTPDLPMKVVIALHGLGGSPSAAHRQYRFEDYAKGGEKGETYGDEASEFLTVYPEGLSNTGDDVANATERRKSWNAGLCCGYAQQVDFDDAQFLAYDLISSISRDYSIDSSKIYLTGFSNGCLMTHRLLCSYPEVFAAASCAGGMLAFPTCYPIYSQTNSPHPLRLKTLHGSADPMIPPSSASSAFRFWGTFEECSRASIETSPIGSSTTCSTYKDCETNAELSHCVRQGGVHVWYRDEILDYSYEVLNFFGLVP